MMSNRPDPNALVKKRVGAKTFNFPSKVSEDKQELLQGSEIEGEVLDREVTQQTDPDNDNAPLFWDAEQTKPKWQLVITLGTKLRDPQNPDDDGKRRIFAKYKMLDAISEAVEEAEAEGVEVGGYLKVEHHDIIPPEKKHKHRSPTKLFRAEYTTAADRLVQTGGTPKVEEPEPAKAVDVETRGTDPATATIDPAAAAAALAALPEETRKALGLA